MFNSDHVKIHVYCPKKAAEAVRLAMGKAGAGKMGNYSYCAFVSSGHGYFLPLEGSTPAIGEIGKMQEVEEVKIEVLCQKSRMQTVVEAIKKAHPYEEVPIDIVPLLSLE